MSQRITNVNLLTSEMIRFQDQPFMLVRGNTEANTFKIHRHMCDNGTLLVLVRCNETGRVFGWTDAECLESIQAIKDFCN